MANQGALSTRFRIEWVKGFLLACVLSFVLGGCGRVTQVGRHLGKKGQNDLNGNVPAPGGHASVSPSPHPTPTPSSSSSPAPSPTVPGAGGGTGGSGGAWSAGQVGRSPRGAYIYIPKSYNPAVKASPVIFLFHIRYQNFVALADAENIILVDTEPLDRGDTVTCNGGQTYSSGYVDQKYILNLIAESRELLIKQYNIDLARVYYAGWSHGGDLAMKFGSLPTAASPAPDDSQEVACSSPSSELLSLQQTAHAGQVEVAGVMVFPGHYGYYQIDLWKQTNSKGTRRGCFAYSVGSNDDVYTRAYNILMPKLQQVPGYLDRIYYKTWDGRGHDLASSPSAVGAAWNWLKDCNTVSN